MTKYFSEFKNPLGKNKRMNYNKTSTKSNIKPLVSID